MSERVEVLLEPGFVLHQRPYRNSSLIVDCLTAGHGRQSLVARGARRADSRQRALLQAFQPLLAKAKGSIVCISSIAGLEALGAPATYSAAKAALNAYVRSVARPLARAGVRINAVAPGNFESETWSRKDPAAVQAMLEREVALKRLGKPREIADFVVFLASPRAAFATGAVFVVDGGQTRA